jgi:uncharacterized protein YjdB
MHPAVRVIAVAALAAVSLTCADRTVTGGRLGQFARLAITPVLSEPPEGGPDIDVRRIKGQLTRLNGSDSIMTEALVEGDSAILEFTNVTVRGDSTAYQLGIEAFDAEDALVFKASQIVKVKPGENEPVTPGLQYVAADKLVDAIEIKAGSTAVDSVQLDWAGADQNNTECLNKAPKAGAVTQQQLTILGTAAGQTVANVRVGYRSRDPRVVAVDSAGLLKARCSNKSTYVVARTFLNVVDSVKVNVTAPAFSLIMSPDSVILERGTTKQLRAIVVDENNNETTATGVTFASSDATRATVHATTGVVQALRNGRVLITASVGNRTTVGVVQVVRPMAAVVKIIPPKDTLGFGQVRQFFARALDAAGRVIGDATGFSWSSSDNAIATVGETGVATAKQVAGDVTISASIDGKTGTSALNVKSALAPGTIIGTIKDGSADAPLMGATISAPACTATSQTDGTFSLPCVQAGDDISIAYSGYVTVTFYDAPAFPGKTVQLPTIPLSPTSGSNGTMQGKVVNAFTGNGVKDMTIKAYAGLHAAPSPRRPDVTPVATTMSLSDGTFSLQAPAGAYTFVASGTGYSEGVGVGISVGGSTKFTPPIILPPVIPGGGIFIVLTWGNCGTSAAPCDLDAHLTGPKLPPDDATRFHIYKSSTTSSYIVDIDTIANVDVDRSTAGTTPEVIGLRPSANPGLYRFYVNDVANSGNPGSLVLADLSGARVDIFQDNRVIATFFPPRNQAGNLWEVFHYDGARIFPIGQITPNSAPATLP